MARKALSASQRWQVLARDAFTCCYCGAQAGQSGVTLHVDHLVSVADGGDNAFDNLVTACQRCNGGKGARSLDTAPASEGAVDRLVAKAETLRRQAEAVESLRQAQEEARQAMVNVICNAYGVESIRISDQHIDRYLTLVDRHGADRVRTWIYLAAQREVAINQSVIYVQGIIRKLREKGAVA
jgi:hypothetical protein